jgi:hypothetical protein
MADYHMVPLSALIPDRPIYDDREGATFSAKHDEGMNWYYMADQVPEVVLPSSVLILTRALRG